MDYMIEISVMKELSPFMHKIAKWPNILACNLKKSCHRCFPVKFVKFLRTSFLQNTSRRLLLYFETQTLSYLTLKIWDPIQMDAKKNKNESLNNFFRKKEIKYGQQKSA